MKASVLFLVVNYLLAVVLAAYPPVAPTQGSYTWEIVISDEKGPEAYTGGRTLYDFVSGYVRMDSFDEPDPSPGINGVTVWDMREAQPIVTTIDPETNCWVEKLDDNVEAPTPLDFSGYKLAGTKYFNRALSEEWTDGYGGVVYVDVFSRDVVGMGNTSTAEDGEAIFYNIRSWSDVKPDGTAFLLPNTIQCKNLNTSSSYVSVDKRAAQGLKCTACKLGIGVVIGRLCSGAAGLACAAFPPSVPFCAVLAGLACKIGAGKLTKEKACQVIRAC